MMIVVVFLSTMRRVSVSAFRWVGVPILLGSTGFYRVLPGFTGFYLVFHLKMGHPGVLTYSYRELPSFAKFYWVLQGFT